MPPSTEKHIDLEVLTQPASPSDPERRLSASDKDIERKILRKLDFTVMPVLWFLFLVSFVDRGNIGNAHIQGMDKSLHLQGNNYNIAFMLFTLAYVIFGIPANIVFRLTGPKSLSIMMFCWGFCVIGQGLTRSYAGLAACRFLEGVCEAGFVPGAAYLIGSYYKKNEFLKRYAVFFSAAIIAGAFNGLFANLLARMDNVGGYEGWRWIFIIEGLVTVVVAFASYFIMIDFPEKTTMFKGEEKRVLLARVAEEGDEKIQDRSELFKALKDWRIWAATIAYIGAEENISSVTAFQPTVLKGLGYTSQAAQIHTIPIFLVAFFVTLACAYLSDRFEQRYLFGMLGAVVTTVGLGIEIGQPKAAGTRYLGMFFLTAGPYIMMPILVVWLAITVGKGYRRVVALACVTAVGNCGAFISSNVFITSQAPKFSTGFRVGLGMNIMSIAAMTILFVGLKIEARRAARR